MRFLFRVFVVVDATQFVSFSLSLWGGRTTIANRGLNLIKLGRLLPYLNELIYSVN